MKRYSDSQNTNNNDNGDADSPGSKKKKQMDQRTQILTIWNIKAIRLGNGQETPEWLAPYYRSELALSYLWNTSSNECVSVLTYY